ncbi:MAG: MotA/TolQ/ExbB proton channel family protein [Campylobacterales bacterium]|nr:MotA/TolQ/ExbB proton channel family protein [Campylobacterales bacterium]
MKKSNYKEIFRLKKEKILSCSSNLIKILSVPTLLVFVVLIAYMGFLPLQMELHSIVIIGTIYLVFTFFVKHNACYSTCTFHQTKMNLAQEISEYIEENLIVLMGEEKAIGSIDKFFDRYSQKLRNDNFATVAAGTFPTLGILGTFISIALSMPDFNSGSADVLNHEITKLLGGVGTAFYASIYGIFLSLWWVFFEKKGFSLIEKELQEMKEEFEENLWSEEELARATFVEQRTSNRELKETIKQSFSPEFLLKLHDTIITQTSMLFQTLKADRQFHEELRSTYNVVVEKLASITNMQDVVAQKLDVSVTKANESYTHLSDNVDKLKLLSELFQSNYDAITSFSIQTDNISNSLEVSTNNLINTQSSMIGVSNQLSIVSDSMDNLVDKLMVSTDKQILVSQTLDKSITTANISYEALSRNVLELESVSKGFKSNHELIILQNKSSKQIATILEKSLGELNTQTNKIDSFFGGFSNNLAEAHKSIGAMSDTMLDLSKGMLNLLDGLNGTYTDTLEKQMLGVNQSLSSLELLYSRFHETIDTKLQSFEKVNGSLQSLTLHANNIEENFEDFNVELLEKLDILIHATSKAQETKKR